MQGVLVELVLRLAVTLFTRREPQHRQHMVVVPLPLISQSPLLPTLAIATHAAAVTLGFLKAALARVRSRSAPATRLRRASIGKLTTDMPTRVCFPYEA